MSNTTYKLCLADGTNTIAISKRFSEIELAEECHEHFVKKVLGKVV